MLNANVDDTHRYSGYADQKITIIIQLKIKSLSLFARFADIKKTGKAMAIKGINLKGVASYPVYFFLIP